MLMAMIGEAVEKYVSERGYPSIEMLRFSIFQSFRQYPKNKRKEDLQITLKLAGADVHVGVGLQSPFSERMKETKANLDYLKS